MIVRKRCFVSGRVQGVFFRAFATREAAALRLSGWVRNLTDGRVEVLAEGESDNVAALVKWLHQGSPLSKVRGVEVQVEEATGDLEPFGVSF